MIILIGLIIVFRIATNVMMMRTPLLQRLRLLPHSRCCHYQYHYYHDSENEYGCDYY